MDRTWWLRSLVVAALALAVGASGAAAQTAHRQPPGSSGGVAFAQAGTVQVRCAIHPAMKLKITVK